MQKIKMFFQISQLKKNFNLCENFRSGEPIVSVYVIISIISVNLDRVCIFIGNFAYVGRTVGIAKMCAR